jgi:hypothetical protein
MNLPLNASIDDIISYIDKNDKYKYHVRYQQANYTNLINTRNYRVAFYFALGYEYEEILINIFNHKLLTNFSFSRNYFKKCESLMDLSLDFGRNIDYNIAYCIKHNLVNFANLCVDRGYNGYSGHCRFMRLFSATNEDPIKLIVFAIVANRATILKKLLSIENYYTQSTQMNCDVIVFFAYKYCNINIINILKKDFRFSEIIENNKYKLLHLSNKYDNVCIVSDILKDNTFNKSKILLPAYFQKNNNDINSIFPLEIAKNIIYIHNNILINHHKNNK